MYKGIPTLSRAQAARRWPTPSPGQGRRISALLHEDARGADLAAERMGLTPSDQLRWVLEKFIAVDLNRLRPEERVALGYDLRRLGVVRPDTLTKRKLGPMADEHVRRIQRETANGLRALLDESLPIGHLDAGWRLPHLEVRLQRWSPTGAKRLGVAYQAEGVEADVIIRAIADLVVNAGERIRACKRCDTLFLANKRQEYCSPACSQRTRNERKADQRAPTMPAHPRLQRIATRSRTGGRKPPQVPIRPDKNARNSSRRNIRA
jgi:hypothetical protein